jgi:hypothetical protein
MWGWISQILLEVFLMNPLCSSLGVRCLWIRRKRTAYSPLHFRALCWAQFRGDWLGNSILRIFIPSKTASSGDTANCVSRRMQRSIFRIWRNHWEHDLRRCKWWRQRLLPGWFWRPLGYWWTTGRTRFLGSGLWRTIVPRSVLKCCSSQEFCYPSNWCQLELWYYKTLRIFIKYKLFK